MITPRILREVENASTNYKSSKPLTSEQKLPKMKIKALGDVQNTLHSRPTNFAIPNRSPSAKILSKSSVHDKATSENKPYLTPLKSVGKLVLATPSTDDANLPEIHNHILCEQEEKSYVNDYFTEYKFSDEQIENLVQSIKCSVIPVSVKLYEPCEDIIPDKKPEEKSFSLTDIFSDMVVPQVPPPVMVL